MGGSTKKRESVGASVLNGAETGIPTKRKCVTLLARPPAGRLHLSMNFVNPEKAEPATKSRVGPWARVAHLEPSGKDHANSITSVCAQLRISASPRHRPW